MESVLQKGGDVVGRGGGVGMLEDGGGITYYDREVV